MFANVENEDATESHFLRPISGLHGFLSGYRCSYKRDPIQRNHNIPALYAIVKNSHIYTVSDNLNMLRQMLPKSSSYDISVKASSDYHLNEKEEPVECKMITSLDDIRKYTEHSEHWYIMATICGISFILASKQGMNHRLGSVRGAYLNLTSSLRSR